MKPFALHHRNLWKHRQFVVALSVHGYTARCFNFSLPGPTGVIRPREFTMKTLSALLLLACLWLSGCGQTGPLYLPEQEQPQPEAPAESQD